MCRVVCKIRLLSEVETVKMNETETSYPIEGIRRDRKVKCEGRRTVKGDEESFVTRE